MIEGWKSLYKLQSQSATLIKHTQTEKEISYGEELELTNIRFEVTNTIKKEVDHDDDYGIFFLYYSYKFSEGLGDYIPRNTDKIIYDGKDYVIKNVRPEVRNLSDGYKYLVVSFKSKYA